MTDEDLGFLPATELAAMIRRKALSPVEVVSTILARIARLEPRLNAFAFLAADQAMDAARAAEAALMGGAPIGRLHGVPVTLKDLLWTRDMPTQYGSRIMQGYRPPIDSPARHPPEGRRRDRPGQDHHLGIRLDRRQPQPADRHHP